MPLAKNFAPNNKTVDIELKCIIKGGALPPFFVKANSDELYVSFANNPVFALRVMMLASGQARFSSGKWGIFDLSQFGICQIRNQ